MVRFMLCVVVLAACTDNQTKTGIMPVDGMNQPEVSADHGGQSHDVVVEVGKPDQTVTELAETAIDTSDVVNTDEPQVTEVTADLLAEATDLQETQETADDVTTDVGPVDAGCGDACPPCYQFGGCDDGNPCTDDSCDSTGCMHQALEGCVYCDAETPCDDADPCTKNVCDGNICAFPPECLYTCDAGTCLPPGCVEDAGCIAGETCVCLGDKSICTTLSGVCDLVAYECVEIDFQNITCVAAGCNEATGKCLVPECVPGSFEGKVENAACDDGDSCTFDECINYTCVHDPSKKPDKCCMTDEKCNDNNPCTVDECQASLCSNGLLCPEEETCTDGQCFGTECQTLDDCSTQDLCVCQGVNIACTHYSGKCLGGYCEKQALAPKPCEYGCLGAACVCLGDGDCIKMGTGTVCMDGVCYTP